MFDIILFLGVFGSFAFGYKLMAITPMLASESSQRMLKVE